MSFTDEYLKALEEEKKKKKKNTSQNTQVKKTQSTSTKNTSTTSKRDDYTSEFLSALDDDIAPVRTTDSEKKYGGGGRKVEDNSTPTIVSISEDGIPRYASKEKKRTWFDKGVLDDGYQFGDITKGILGTGTDATTHIGAGLLGIGEKLADAGAMLGNATYQTTYMQQAMQDEIIYNAVTGKQTEGIVDRYLDEKERSDEATAEFVAKDLYNEEEIAKKIISAPMKNWTGIDSEKDSFFGDKTDALAQSGGQLLGQVAVSAIPGVGQPFAMGMMGASALGSEAESAFKQGATYDEALFSGLVSATAEVVTEKIGGISFGGKTLTDKAVDLFSRKATTKLTRALVTSGKLTADGLAEGGEELLSGYMSALGQKLSYMEEKEIEELFNDDDKLESFIGGLVLGETFGGVSTLASDTNVNGMTKDEQSVIDKVYNDAIAEEEKGGKKLTSKEKNKIYDNVVESVQNGSLGIEVIEEALGGERYEAYKKATDENTALKKERDELNKIKTMELTGEQSDRLAELKGMNLDDTTNLDELGKKWKDDVYNRLSSDRKGQGSLLLESYRERERRGQAFTADLSQYEGKKREAVERAIKSGVLNNTNRSHELVDILSKIEADKGIIFDYTDNKKLKESGFAIDGKTINGFVKDGSITLNMQSSKAWESTVGHEITHVLEGTKVYSELQTSLFEYAKSKGEFDTRKADIMKLYEKVENADIDGELTAELISDYLFNDKSFINHLTGNRTVFQKVWDEVKYLYKVATGKEKASIEKVMKEFDRAWKEMGKANVKSEGTKYSVSDKNIKDESTGYGYGETYFTMSYNQDGKTVATLEYGEYEGTPNVKMVKVDPEYRRQGIATKLLQELQKKYPDTEIDFGMTTPDGTKLLESITYDVTDDTVVAKQNEYKALQAELDELQGKLDVLYDTENLTEAQEAELEKLGDRWTEVYDAIRKLEPELRGKNATKTFVKYSVSEDSEGNQLSKEQSEYFKDSLVRDDNGNLLKVYHGSGSEFTVFNHKYLNTHGNAHGRGFYFTEKKSLAEGYSEEGGQLLEGYLNITKPLSEDKVTMKKADLVKLIKATCKAEAQEYVADGGYETVAEALPDTWISNYVDTYSTNLNDAYREVADIIYSGNDNDVEIISEITNAGAGNENTLKLTKDVLGYDGVIYTANDGTHEFVTLVSEQFKSADNINPTDNPDIRFSLSEDTKKLDSEYMLAVENGDMETTQRIVDEAAKSAGYDIKAYHGTGYDFTVFDKSRQGDNYEDWGRLGKGFYFAPTSREAETWAELSRGGKNKVMPVYLRSENMLDSFEALPDNLKDTIPENWDSLTRRLAEKYAYNYIEYMQEFGYNVQEILTEKGYDGINGHTEYVVFDPEQVKSADAITYDDKGNVIPLSERFNKENEDIRYSLSYENTAHSTFGTPLKDLYFEQDIAPIREDVAKNATTTPKAEAYIDDYAPITAEEAEAINKESFEHIGDKDIPPEVEQNTDYVPDRIVLDTKSLKQLTKAIGEKLPLTDKFARADLEKIIQDFSTGKIASKEGLVAEVKKKFNTYYYKERSDEIAKIKESIRKIPVYVSDNIKGDFGKGKDGYFNFMQKHFGKIRFSKDGLSVDRLYDALTEVYPGYFSADVWNDAERLRVIADVVDTPTTQNIPQPVDDRTLEETADFIYDSVQEYKGTVRLTNALDLENAPIDESLVPPVGEDEEVVAPDEAEVNSEPITPKSTRIADGTRGEELLVESLVNYPMQTVEQKVAEKIRSVEAELADKRDLRREAENDYNNKIANLQKQYADKKDKTTLTAYNLLQSISRLEGLKARADADYAKRISDLEARLEKMKEPTYTRAMQKQAKMQEHAKFAENLLGDTSTWVDKNIGLKYEVNTERRNLRDIVRDENGNKDIARADAIYDALMGEYNRNHAELNRKDNEISKKYHDLKITRAESVYANMLGELRHNPESKLTKEAVAEYYEKHKEKIDVKKVDKVIDYVRADLDYFFETLNAVLREQGMKEIPYRKGYFPHATFPKQGFIAKLLNWKVQDNEIPTSIAGLTEDFKPVKSYQSFDKQRHGDKTDYDIMQMFEKYKDGALDWIYHIEDIQKRRAVENYIRSEYSEEGIQARIKEVYASEDMDADEAQTRIDEILSKSSHLSHFVQDFMTKTNILANKKNSLDRAMEQKFNRNIYSVMQNVQNRTSANMVLANIRSALTNIIPITQSWAQVSPLRSLQATKDVIANAIKDDGMVEKSTFLTNRLKQADKLYQTNWDKILDKAGIMFEIVDNISSQVIWRSKYNQNLANGMSEADAIANADQFAENVMAGRSKGNEPTLFNAKNPLIKAFTTFQLEVNNQYGYYFKDVPNDLKAETNHWKFNLAKGYTTAFIGAYVYNALLSKVTGSDAALDPIGIIEELLRDLGLFDDDEEKEVSEAFENLGSNVIEELPFVGGILGGGRIPISTALPIKELVTGKDSYGNKKPRWETFLEAAPYTVLPVGYGQIKKTVQGLGMFNTDEEHPVMGSYTDSGKLRFPVEDTPLNRVQAALFGQYANENAREYFDNGYDALNKKQIQEYQDVDLPIADYWKYREGLKGLKKNEEKADFINSLDIEDWQKNILMNNILDRKEDVDMTNYDEYADFEEFDYAQKNPEKYEVAKSFGDFKAFVKYTEAIGKFESDKDENGETISGSEAAKVADYIASLDIDNRQKNILINNYLDRKEDVDMSNYDDYGSWYEFDYAQKNPEKYAVSKAVGGYDAYIKYSDDLKEIEGEKDANGKTKRGTEKANRRNYIFSLKGLDDGQKAILYRSLYDSADDKAEFDEDIVYYINGRNDLTDEEKVTIYTELGFTVKDGYVYW